MSTHPSMNSPSANADQAEIAKFQALAATWWDPESDFKPLHQINPLRLNWIETLAGPLSGRHIIDVGCGGGILAESMARHGAHVTGIDLADKALRVAQLHGLESGVTVHYEHVAAETMAQRSPASYDMVTCMELLEHVPDPASIIRACAQLVRPGGWVFFSTIHRQFKSFMLAIVGAEYILNLLPRGTHDYRKLIRPSELQRAARAAALHPIAMTGLTYNPLARRYQLDENDVSVNYLVACQRPV